MPNEFDGLVAGIEDRQAQQYEQLILRIELLEAKTTRLEKGMAFLLEQLKKTRIRLYELEHPEEGAENESDDKEDSGYVIVPCYSPRPCHSGLVAVGLFRAPASRGEADKGEHLQDQSGSRAKTKADKEDKREIRIEG